MASTDKIETTPAKFSPANMRPIRRPIDQPIDTSIPRTELVQMGVPEECIDRLITAHLGVAVPAAKLALSAQEVFGSIHDVLKYFIEFRKRPMNLEEQLIELAQVGLSCAASSTAQLEATLSGAAVMLNLLKPQKRAENPLAAEQQRLLIAMGLPDRAIKRLVDACGMRHAVEAAELAQATVVLTQDRTKALTLLTRISQRKKTGPFGIDLSAEDQAQQLGEAGVELRDGIASRIKHVLSGAISLLKLQLDPFKYRPNGEPVVSSSAVRLRGVPPQTGTPK